MAVPKANPKDSMVSTWRRKSRSEWTAGHWFFEVMGAHPTVLDKPIPVSQPTDALRYVPEWQFHRWILLHAALPVALQQLFCLCAGRNFTTAEASIVYGFTFNLSAAREMNLLRWLAHEVGFLDGHRAERDGVPDLAVHKVMWSILGVMFFRPAAMMFLTYETSEQPRDMSWAFLVIEIFLYGIILDFWFYWYHRLMHEAPCLWKYHRIHHSASHPNSLLSQYADTEQVLLDLLGVPVLTHVSMKALGLPWGFHQWWICHIYVLFAEWGGHSGLRLYASPPSTFTPVLRWLKCETTIEDHDLHHRRGRRRNGNYGKQTRLWDVVFGTCVARIECRDDNIDWDRVVALPVF